MKVGPLLLVIALTIEAALAPARAQPYVPDEATAIAIAEAVSRPMLGNDVLAKIRPFTATLHGDEWWVFSLPNLKPDDCPTCVGHAVWVRINRDSGAIMDWGTVH